MTINMRSIQAIKRYAVCMIMTWCLFAPWVTIADLIRFPSPPEVPLHRIGIELVLESVTATIGGGALFRWLVKNGWKKRTQLKDVEKGDMGKRVTAVLPELCRSFSEALAKKGILDIAPSIRGVIRGVCSRCGCHVGSGARFCSGCGLNVEHNGMTVEHKLGQYVHSADGSNIPIKEVIEIFLRENPAVMQKLEGLPIEFIVDKLSNYGEDIHWMSKEEEDEWKRWMDECDNIRKNHVSPSSRLMVDKTWLEIRRLKQYVQIRETESNDK